jgi:Uncharacterized conserved protein (DUF2045)
MASTAVAAGGKAENPSGLGADSPAEDAVVLSVLAGVGRARVAERVRRRREASQNRKLQSKTAPAGADLAAGKGDESGDLAVPVDAFHALLDAWFLDPATASTDNCAGHLESGDDMLYFVKAAGTATASRREESGEGAESDSGANGSSSGGVGGWLSPLSSFGRRGGGDGAASGATTGGGQQQQQQQQQRSGPVRGEDLFFVKRMRDVASCAEIERARPGIVDWEETLYLNVLLHKFVFTVEVSVRQNHGTAEKPDLRVQHRVRKNVFAVPNRIRMDKAKAEDVQYTYPVLFFAVDDFNDAWKGISLADPKDMVCVELFASGQFLGNTARAGARKSRVRVFAGALSYDVIHQEYRNKSWVFQSGSKQHFFKLRGPMSHGGAEMAVCTKLPREETDGGGDEDAGQSLRTKAFSWLGSPRAEVQLHCMLTSLSLPWYVLLHDLFESIPE